MLFLFIGLSVVFFYMARQPQAFKTSNRQGTPFALGFLVAGMNLVNVVFLFAMGTFLEAKGWISLQPPNKWLFMAGAALGCLLLLILYSQFATLDFSIDCSRPTKGILVVIIVTPILAYKQGWCGCHFR